MKERIGVGAALGGSRPGGGWRALLADVLGAPEASPTATLLAALTDPPTLPDGIGTWDEATLDDAWRHANELEGRFLADDRMGPATLSEVS